MIWQELLGVAALLVKSIVVRVVSSVRRLLCYSRCSLHLCDRVEKLLIRHRYRCDLDVVDYPKRAVVGK